MKGHPNKVVILGAGHAGSTAAASLRHQGFAGELVLLSDELHYPYDRPPLSKSLFTDKPHSVLLPENFYAEREIDLRLGVTAATIDRTARVLELKGGERLSYDVLIIATGARARKLSVPGTQLDGVHELRTRGDAWRLEAQVPASARLAIIGGGWIGLEVAAAAVSANHRVTVIEREDRVLARVASRELSGFVAGVHRERGTEILTEASVAELVADQEGAVSSVVLQDGRRVPCDQALIAVGAIPNDDLAQAAGLDCDGGIVVDEYGATSDPQIFAVGDVTRRPVHRREGLYRLESIPSAHEQVRRAVARILGLPAPNHEVPWFWSDQFGLKVQIAGLLDDEGDGDHSSMIRCGDPARRSVAYCHVSQGRLRSIEAVNAIPAFMTGRTMIRDAVDFDRAAIEAALGGQDSGLEDAAEAAPATSASVTMTPVVTFLTADDGEQQVEVPLGSTVMVAALDAAVPGILGNCGGGCSCGTCHVYVDESWLPRLEPPSEIEIDMLEFVAGAKANSRLCCQITMTDELSGIVLTVAEEE